MRTPAESVDAFRTDQLTFDGAAAFRSDGRSIVLLGTCATCAGP